MRKRKGLLGLYQFVERSLLIPEVRGSALVIGKIYIEHLFVYLLIINFIEKTKINKKRPGIAHFFKKTWVMTKLSSHWIRGLTLDDQLYF